MPSVADIMQYSDMCDSSRSALLAKNHGSDAVDDYMEFHDTLDNFEEAYCGEWDSEEEFSPMRSKLLRGRPAHYQ